MEFLRSITPREALKTIASFPLRPLRTTTADLDSSLGRVLAEDIVAREEIPPFSRSLVDGYAVKVKDTYGARESNPAFLMAKGDVRVGQATGKKLSDGEAIYVATGAMVPEGTDGVVMQEYARPAQDAVEITRSVRKGENIVFTGEDVKRGQTIARKGKVLTPFDLGVLAALGVTTCTVYKVPEVGLISSGDEIVPADQVPPHGKVRDINSHTVAGLVRRERCAVRFGGIARDTVEDITGKLQSVRETDMVLLSGGSSKGQSDFMTTVIEQLGGEVLFHGLSIRPGKPTIFASLWGKPVFGLPGHPVSCSMVVMRFVAPLLKRLKGEEGAPEWRMAGRLTTNVPSTYGVEEYVRVTVQREDDGVAVTPVFAKSSVISMLSLADGYIVVPEGKEGFEAGEEVEVFPLG